MYRETGHSKNQEPILDIKYLEPTQRDWDIISGSIVIRDPKERCYIIDDLCILDPKRQISQATQEDWDYFFERMADLNESHIGIVVSHRLMQHMARVDREKAIAAFKSGDLDTVWKPGLRKILKREEGKDGLFPGYLQEFLIAIDPEETKKVFDEQGDSAWDFERDYVPWLRRESPNHFLTLLAALSEIDKDRTLSLLEQSDLTLAQQGLTYYREQAVKNEYCVDSLIQLLATLKKLTPLFEQLLQQKTS